MTNGMIYYVNGDFVRAEDAALPLGDLAIVRGFGVFDFLRTYNHVPFMLREHVARLLRSAQLIGLHMPLSLAEIESVVHEANDRNGLPDAGIRIVATGGVSSSFMMPEDNTTLAVMVEPVKPVPQQTQIDGAAVTTTDIPRVMPTIKSLNYLGAILAVREAMRVGAIEAVYRTPDGLVTEGTRSNLFIVRDGKLMTPGREVLLGITRQAVMDAVAGRYEVMETDVTYDELLAADEVFLTGTTKEVTPISRVDDTLIGKGVAGELTRDVAECFRAYVVEHTAPAEA